MRNRQKMQKTANRTVLLECPKCRKELSGLPVDRIFFCSNCGIGIDFWEDPACIFNVKFADLPDDVSGNIIMLPIWHYELEVEIHSDDQKLTEKALMAAPEHLWIFGSIFQKINVLGNHNLEFKTNPDAPMNAPSQDLAGCQLRRFHADKLVIPLASAIIDRAQDITNMEIAVLIRRSTLCALPFRSENQFLRHIGTGYEINKASFRFHLPAFKSM